MTQVLSGTSGYSFKQWRGAFYPEKLSEKLFLPYYAERLCTVELNNTFYRMPTVAAVSGWCSAVSPDFRFSVKAPQRITHMTRLKEPEVLLADFERVVRGFGPQLGVVLFQFPPQFSVKFERLQEFRRLWPRELPTALEFRHPSWDNDEVRAWMREHELAWVVNDGDEAEDEEPGALPAASPADGPDQARLEAAVGGGLLYVRLRKAEYTEAELTQWAQRLAATSAATAFAFFKHEVQGPGYALALRDGAPRRMGDEAS